jgi:hypothetical protein
MKKGLIAVFTILFFCNFGRVEYSALNPKAKIIQVDSSAKSMPANSPKLDKQDVSEQESTETSDESRGWSKYIVIGIKTFFATLLKLLIA